MYLDDRVRTQYDEMEMDSTQSLPADMLLRLLIRSSMVWLKSPGHLRIHRDNQQHTRSISPNGTHEEAHRAA